jgi:ABC-type nickel/cobalt efflux system permease component RcnA
MSSLLMSGWSGWSAWSFWAVGLVLGMRHALEPDHLAAVSTFLMGPRSQGGAGAWLGVLWGVGHTLSLLAVATALAALGTRLPDRLADAFELGVAVMLVLLGGRSVRRAWGGADADTLVLAPAGPARTPRARAHAPTGAHAHPPAVGGREGRPRPGLLGAVFRRPLAVGLVHGLAGSGALTALVASRFPTVAGRLVTVGLFGVGSICGMALLSGLAGWPLSRLGRHPGVDRWLGTATGTFSLCLGALWGWPLLGRLFVA